MRILTIIVLLLSAVSLTAQETPIIGQYVFNEMIINPASTGKHDVLNAQLSYRKQWIQVEGAPSTQNFSIQSPLKNANMGLGLLVYNDRIGVTNETGIMANYSYRLQLDQSNEIRFGLAGGILMNKVNYADLTLTDVSDITFAENSPLFVTPNFNFGVQYVRNNLEVGFSIPSVLSHEYTSGGKARVYNDFSSYNYLLRAMYAYELNDIIVLRPNFLLRYNSFAKAQLDFNIMGEYRERYKAGLGVRTSEGVLVMLGVGLNSQFDLGLQYEIPTSKLYQYKSGTIELLLIYNALFKTKAANPRSF